MVDEKVIVVEGVIWINWGKIGWVGESFKVIKGFFVYVVVGKVEV